MPGAAEIHVRGAKELERAFRQLRKDVLRELRPALREIGEVVRVDAQQRAGSEISQIGSTWQRMRLGVTAKGVYITPASRRRGGSPRPNLAGLLMSKSMQPAVDAHQSEVLEKLDALVAVSAKRAGF
jgi:hypothetical protein